MAAGYGLHCHGNLNPIDSPTWTELIASLREVRTFFFIPVHVDTIVAVQLVNRAAFSYIRESYRMNIFLC